MLEISSQDDRFLCITYNYFDVTNYRLENINLEYHLRNLVKLVLVGVVGATEEAGINRLSRDDRHLLYLFIKEYLSQINQTELKNAISSVQNFEDRAKEWWNNFSGPVGIVINTFLDKIGFAKAEIKSFDTQGGRLGGFEDQLRVLQQASKKLGYQCVYLLVDKVDESMLTGKASNSYRFIASLLGNLQLLELPGFGFKFFLWNMLLESYRKDARPDRIKYHQLNWNKNQLKEMLSKRLKAHSNSRVTSFEQICSINSIDNLIVLFSQGSPRNIIRICKEIIDQQSEISSDSNEISINAVVRGFEVFSENYTKEILPDTIIKELRKTKRVDFTVKHLYVNVFKFTQQAGMTKARTWQETGVVEQLGVIPETVGAKASNHYGITNLIVAKHVFSELSIFEFANRKVFECSSCGQVLIRDWDVKSDYPCHSCQAPVIKT